MKLWILGLLLLGIALPLTQSQDENYEDEVSPFNINTRQVNGKPISFVTMRQSDDEDDDYDDDDDDFGTQDAPDTGDEQATSMDQDQVMEVGASTAAGTQETSAFLIKDKNSVGNAGILVIQSGDSAKPPVMFELRPMMADPKEPITQADTDTSDGPVFEVDIGQGEMDPNDNRYDPDNDADYTSTSPEGYQEPLPPKRRVKPTQKPTKKPPNQANRVKPKKKAKRKQRPYPTQKPNSNTNRKPIRKKRPTKKRRKTTNPKRTKHDKRRKPLHDFQRGQNYVNLHDSSFNHKKRLGYNINKGSGSNTVTNTVTTTHTGTGNEPNNVNCIVINKQPTPTTEPPFWGLLGRTATDSETGKSSRHGRRLCPTS